MQPLSVSPPQDMEGFEHLKFSERKGSHHDSKMEGEIRFSFVFLYHTVGVSSFAPNTGQACPGDFVAI